MEQCAVTSVLSKEDRVSGVETTHGAIECEYFVNCAGFWARQVSQSFVCVLLLFSRNTTNS